MKPTPRQLEVLALVAEGHLLKVVADKLSISVRTVHVHSLEVVKRLGAKTQAQAVAIAIRSGVLK